MSLPTPHGRANAPLLVATALTLALGVDHRDAAADRALAAEPVALI